MFKKLFTKVFGTKNDRELKRLAPIVREINEIYTTYRDLSDEELRGLTDKFRQRYADGETLDELLPEAYAAVKDACRRLCGESWMVCEIPYTWDMVPYDVQLIGGIAMHEGKIAEMATGEGKTLVAAMPAYLNALTGRGVHIITVNDYLSKRDSQWIGHIYEFLGLTVGCIQSDMDPTTRKPIYDCDVVYGTNSEFGFDYLRDNGLAMRKEHCVQRDHYFAIVDEVDSVLIDEARTPLIISGPASVSNQMYGRLKPLVEQLVHRQRAQAASLLDEVDRLISGGADDTEIGTKLLQARLATPKNKKLMKMLEDSSFVRLMQKVEMDYLRDKRMHEITEALLYSIDEKSNAVEVTDRGFDALSPHDHNLFLVPDLSTATKEIQDKAAKKREELIAEFGKKYSVPNLVDLLSEARRKTAAMYMTDIAELGTRMGVFNLGEKLAEIDNLVTTEERTEIARLYAAFNEKSEQIHNIQQLLKAYSLFEKDVDYVVQENKVVIVDSFTGRLQPSRRYSDGLHQALEAKEGVEIERETQTYATITIQNYFRLYEKLAGMTGTAETEAGEFWQIYKLEVLVIPTNANVRRLDYDDLIFKTKREKYYAIIQEIIDQHQMGRPILVGTISVDVSEILSRMLKRTGISHAVLNAKYHEHEAQIVAKAGQAGAVTIATNMAGRGTDIKLGPGVVKCKKCCVKCVDRNCASCEHEDRTKACLANVPCGLHIVGSERHDARRIDRQLRGRSGRQGDPGSSRFFLSLEDDLMRLFGSDRLSNIMGMLGMKENQPITAPMVTKAIERAQRRVEEAHFGMRKRVLEYDDVMNKQREVIYDLRRQILLNDDLREGCIGMIEDYLSSVIDNHYPTDPDSSELDFLPVLDSMLEVYPTTITTEQMVETRSQEDLKEIVKDDLDQAYAALEVEQTPEIMRMTEKMVMLMAVDNLWKEHLYEMDDLREGIYLRSYAQLDPLVEYKQEAFALFEDLLDRIYANVAKTIFHRRAVMVGDLPDEARKRLQKKEQDITKEREFYDGGSKPKPKVVRTEERVGRNDPCPCGSGKKYKKCCGAEDK